MNPFIDRIEKKRNRVALAAQGGKGRFSGPGVFPQVIDQGQHNPFSRDGDIHAQAITLKLINSDATNPADIILTAGMYAGLPDYSAQVLDEGVNSTTNDDGDTVSVTLNSQLGVDSAMNWDYVKTIIREDGLAVAGFNLMVETQAQLSNPIMIVKRDLYGNHNAQKLEPFLQYNPKNFDGKFVQFDTGFALNKDTVLKYRLEADETVTLQLFVAALYKPHRIIEQAAIASGNVIGQ